jgi:hypothetical protein
MWYAANLLFQSAHIPTESKPTIWEESVRLIEAQSEMEARESADRMGKAEAQTYEVKDGIVIWKFDRVERVYRILDQELRSGSEVFSRFLRDSEVRSLLTPFNDEP